MAQAFRLHERYTALLALGLLLLAAPGTAAARERGRGGARPPMLITLIHHHSTRGISEHALPVVAAVGGRATLAVMILELPRSAVPPDEISATDEPGGLGNVQPLTLGAADADGLWPGRIYQESPEKFMTEAQLQALAAAGWEVAFHGADHTAQHLLVEQVDGPGKLARAYAATGAEIRRILDDPAYPVRTNTLASNGWSAAAREVARAHFDWTEVSWRSSQQHVPVAFSRHLDFHGGFNSVEFRRDQFDGPADIQELVRLARTAGGGWLVIQLHDVVAALEDSPDPPNAMLVDEYRLLVEELAATGARFVTFAEGAGSVHQDIGGNLIRNSFFGQHPFKDRPEHVRLDWTVSGPTAAGEVAYLGQGVLGFTSATPGRLTAEQIVLQDFRDDARFVLRLTADLSGRQEGSLSAGIQGPAGGRLQEIPDDGGGLCLEFSREELQFYSGPAGPLRFLVDTFQFVGQATVGDISLEALRPGVRDCRFPGARPRR